MSHGGANSTTGRYWASKLSRRRALASGLAFTAGAMALAACGGGSDEKTTSNKTSLLSQPVDAGEKAAKGGTYAWYIVQDTPSFDGFASNATAAIHNMYAYSRLIKYKSGKYPKLPTGEVEPDAATSWEVSPDKLTYTFKLRPNMKFDSRPPTNGRAMTSADVAFSWKQYSTLQDSRGDLANSVNKDAPITSVQTPDPNTVVMKLAFPYSPLLPMLAFYRYLPIFPVEADGGFNSKADMRGTGAWRLSGYRPSQSFSYVKNPDWYDAAKTNLDGIEMPIIPEYATELAQFLAGKVWNFQDIRPEDILSTKQAQSSLMLQTTPGFSQRTTPNVRFSYVSGSPFNDTRVRQAISMLTDRDLWIETFYNVKEFRAGGLDVPLRWSSHVACGDEAWWLDPKGKDFGENATYFKHDPAEAKKLLRAAGFTSAIKTPINYPNTAILGQQFVPQVQALQGMWEGSGDFAFETNTPDYNTEWVPKYQLGTGDYKGVALGSAAVFPDIDTFLFALYKTGGSRALQHLPQADKTLDDMIDKQRTENDPARRLGIVQDAQRYMAKNMYSIIAPGAAQGFTLAWPWLGNFGVYAPYGERTAPQETINTLWIDQSKKPS